jgi:hypothetical protein
MALASIRNGWAFDGRTEAASTGIKEWPRIPRARCPKIAAEHTAGMSGPKLAKKYGVGTTRTIYLILEKYRREQVQTGSRASIV